MLVNLQRLLNITLLLVPVIFYAVACNQSEVEPGSDTKDIFREDENGIRRKKADDNQRLWTITMNGCTGHLIAPENPANLAGSFHGAR